MSGVDRRELGTIFAGGAAGAVLRVALSRAAPDRAGHWPWITFAINVAGAFLLGYLVTSELVPWVSPAASPGWRTSGRARASDAGP